MAINTNLFKICGKENFRLKAKGSRVTLRKTLKGKRK